jgi:hypothetical protein
MDLFSLDERESTCKDSDSGVEVLEEEGYRMVLNQVLRWEKDWEILFRMSVREGKVFCLEDGFDEEEAVPEEGS